MFGSGPLSLLGGSNPQVLTFVLLAASLILAISLHEFAHAYAADLQGDKLPRAMGRVSLNPVRHLDPIGTLLIFLVGFGWGKPVEFRPQALASRRFGAAIVALAGPLMNLTLSVLGAFALGPLCSRGQSGPVPNFLVLFIGINVVLAVFNLIPLPPLDGSRLLTIFLPPSKQHILFFLDKYGFLILFVILLFGGTVFLRPIIDAVQHWVFSLTGCI